MQEYWVLFDAGEAIARRMVVFATSLEAVWEAFPTAKRVLAC